MREALADGIASDLLDQIVDGAFPAGTALPTESELAARAGVSRLTTREAVKILRAANVVSVRPGRGTYVNPSNVWTGMQALVRAATAQGEDIGYVPRRLIEARRLIEVGIAELAADRRTERDLLALDDAIAKMAQATKSAVVSAFVAADLEFHQALVHASGNVFISALLHPLSRVLATAREQTSEHAVIRDHALQQHRRIRDAVRRGNPDEAHAAMNAHMDQTAQDLEAYVLSSPVKPVEPGSSLDHITRLRRGS